VPPPTTRPAPAGATWDELPSDQQARERAEAGEWSRVAEDGSTDAQARARAAAEEGEPCAAPPTTVQPGWTTVPPVTTLPPVSTLPPPTTRPTPPTTRP
jgi:hypothetical protein